MWIGPKRIAPNATIQKPTSCKFKSGLRMNPCRFFTNVSIVVTNGTKNRYFGQEKKKTNEQYIVRSIAIRSTSQSLWHRSSTLAFELMARKCRDETNVGLLLLRGICNVPVLSYIHLDENGSKWNGNQSPSSKLLVASGENRKIFRIYSSHVV